ncbi:MAG: nucleotidyltransferase family protein [Candidatus Omnitrophota bacterium]
MGKTKHSSIGERNSRKKDIYIQKARECSSFLSQKYHIKKVYLIGSLVNGIFHDRSDIDLVVEGLPAGLYIKALTELYDMLPPGVELNLIPYEDAFDSLKERTVREGQLIYGY